jgi:hypothetical protein
MLQPRQNGTLARQALAQAMIDPLGARQLQRRRALHDAIGAPRHPHRAHAAFGQQPLELPRTDPVARLLATHRGQGRSGELHDRLQRLTGAIEAGRTGVRQKLGQQWLQITRLGR